MYAKKPRYRLWIGILCILLLCAVTGTTVAKYVTARELTGTVTFSAKLAEGMTLNESLAVRQTDGSYILNTGIKIPNEDYQKNQYKLLPGLDVPKDPTITITGKTPIEAYLFVEVVDELTETIESNSYRPITYTVSSDWLELTGVTGKHGGKVYVYKGASASAAILDETFTKDATDQTVKIQILAPLEGKTETVQVSQKLNSQLANDGDDILTFYAAMGEVASGTTPLDVYNSIG